MRKKTNQDLEKLIALFTELSRIIESNNIFALDDVIQKWTFPRYYRKMIDLILWGVNPMIIANNLIIDNTQLLIKAKNKKSEREVIYSENILGFGLYYLQTATPPKELQSKLHKSLLQMRNRTILQRNFQGSYYERFYLV